jgi:hypothetical protein
MYTVELYKQDRRVKGGERLDRKVDHSTADRAAIAEVYAAKYPASQGLPLRDPRNLRAAQEHDGWC